MGDGKWRSATRCCALSKRATAAAKEATERAFTYILPDTNAWINNVTVDLSAIPEVDDNPDFRVRLVSVYDPSYSGPGAPTYTGASGGQFRSNELAQNLFQSTLDNNFSAKTSKFPLANSE